VSWSQAAGAWSGICADATAARAHTAAELARLGVTALSLGELESPSLRAGTQALSAALTRLSDAELELVRAALASTGLSFVLT
jgi:hypothetical protein